MSSRNAVRIEDQLHIMPLSYAEVHCQAEMVHTQRKLEQLKEKLKRLGQHEKNKQRRELTTAAVCMSLTLDHPQKKTRLTTNGRGAREEAIVLTSEEELAASEARQQLRMQRGDLQKAIASAMKEYRAAKSAFSKKLKDIEKQLGSLDKALEKVTDHVNMAQTWANAIDAKKAAGSVAAAPKSAMVVETVLAALEPELVTIRDAMVVVDST